MTFTPSCCLFATVQMEGKPGRRKPAAAAETLPVWTSFRDGTYLSQSHHRASADNRTVVSRTGDSQTTGHRTEDDCVEDAGRQDSGTEDSSMQDRTGQRTAGQQDSRM